MLQILFVDDEQRLLDGLRRTLRPLRHEWNCEFANQGAEALRALDQKAFDVVVTDMRMPAMDGLELLKQVKTRYPHILRIVLSGQSEMEKVIKISGVSHQYLAKPCRLDHLKSAVKQVLTLKELLSNPALIELASRVDVIHTESPVYWELETLLNSLPVDMNRIGSLIIQDMGMCAKVLQMANYGGLALMEPICDPAYAAGLLGVATLQSLCSANHAARSFHASQAKEFGMDELWKHSIRCSLFAGEIARTLAPSCQETQNQARVAGLLHDVGQLIMACSLPEEYRKSRMLAAAEGISQVEAERKIFQTSHAEFGAYIMALWSLPNPIVNAIAYHHHPSSSTGGKSDVLTAVHVAELLTSRKSAGESTETALPDDGCYLKSLGLMDHLAEWQKSLFETAL